MKMRRFFYNLLRRLPVRVRQFLPEILINPPQLTPAERTHEILTDFTRELGVGPITRKRDWFWKVLKAAHQQANDISAAAFLGMVAASGIATIALALTGAGFRAALAVVIIMVLLAGTSALTIKEGGGKGGARFFAYTFLGELAVLAFTPLIFEISFFLSGTPFALLAVTYLFQGIAGARTGESTLPLFTPTTEQEVEKLGKEYLRRFIERYAPEVRGGETRIDADLNQHMAVRAEAVELKAYWQRRKNGVPSLRQAELDRAERNIARADREIAWLRERKQEMSDALATLKAHLEPLTGALTDYYQIQRADALEGRQSENTERAREYVYALQARVREDVTQLLAAVATLQERLLPNKDGGSITHFLASAEQAGETAARLDSASRRI